MTKARQQAGQSSVSMPCQLPCQQSRNMWSWGRDVFARRCFPIRNSLRVFATVRNRSQLSANVHDDSAMAVPMGSAAKVVTFGGFKRRVTSFRVAGVALCDIPTCFTTCQKSFCVTGAKLLHRFQEMISISRGRRSTLDVSIFVAGTAL